jgi:hypothetical protein
MEGNVWKIGFNPKINKAIATLISGYRLFFWLKIRCFKGIQRLCFATITTSRGMRGNNNIYWYMEFAGIVRGGGKVKLLYAKKNIIDWYSDVDNLLIRCG